VVDFLIQCHNVVTKATKTLPLKAEKHRLFVGFLSAEEIVVVTAEDGKIQVLDSTGTSLVDAFKIARIELSF